MCCDSDKTENLNTADVIRLPQAKPHARIAYGSAPQQFGELRLPHTERGCEAGKFPIAIVIHGGCWSAEYDLGYMSAMSAALTDRGMATWSIEYRRVGDPGGGWPGTFHDVAGAADYVRELANQYPIDVERVVAVGHSAGGHLALWAAARPKLANSSELYSTNPIALRGVVCLAGIPDLATAGTRTGCGDMGHRLMGGEPQQFFDRYQQASPAELLPLGVKQVLIHGEQDQLVPHRLSADYESRARKSGDDVTLVSIPAAGHFELVVPTTEAWKRVEESVTELVRQS